MKHNIGDIWVDLIGELRIKTINGTKTYYRYIVEQYIGLIIPEGYTVHHIDYYHTNNELNNLIILPTPLHVWLHRTNGSKDLFVSNLQKIKDRGYII